MQENSPVLCLSAAHLDTASQQRDDNQGAQHGGCDAWALPAGDGDDAAADNAAHQPHHQRATSAPPSAVPALAQHQHAVALLPAVWSVCARLCVCVMEVN